MREHIRRARLIASTAFRADAPRAVASFVLEPVSQLVHPLFGLWMKFLADGAAQGRQGRALLGAAGLAVSIGTLWLAGGVGARLRLTLDERVTFAFDRRIAELTAGIPGLEHHELPQYLDRLELLRQSQGALTQSLTGLVMNVSAAVQITASAALLATLHPVLLVLPLFAVPSLWVNAISARRAEEAEEGSASERRLARHLLDLAITGGPAKEVRVFGLSEEIVRRHRDVWMRGHARRVRSRAVATAWGTAGWATFSLGFAGAVTLVTIEAANGRSTPGDVLLAITLASQMNNQLSWLVQNVAWLMRSLRVVGRMLWLEDHARAVARPGGLAPPARLAEGITIDRVSFRYPETEGWVLRDLSLHLDPGSTVALVGDNGAGKTTLVKLLCGFYEPTEGRILVDGIPLDSLDPGAWRARIASAYQDFCKLELVASESVGAGDLPRIDDRVAVGAALARAGAGELPSTLPRGLDTQLGYSWEDGVDLSVGQWQKIALGRALMRDEPLLVIFDEPTSSLDAETEHALFERFAAAARDARATGRVTVLVSHRFSTVRMADLIVVVGDGRALEQGTHDALIAAGGVYAELYALQARAYR